jgi:hypothetical protein
VRSVPDRVEGERENLISRRRATQAWFLACLLVGVVGTTLVASGAGASGTSGPHLVFFDPPADTQVGSVITSARFDPAATPVRVALVGSNGQVIKTNGASITISAGAQDSLLQGTKTQPLVSGIATFGDLSIGQTGAYALTASGGSYPSVTSDPFAIVTLGVLCQGSSCSGTVTGPTSTNVNASSISDGTTLGITTLSSNTFPSGVCGAGFTPLGTGSNVDIRPSPGLTEITVTWSKELVDTVPNNGASFFNLCLGTDHVFTTKSGVQAVFLDGAFWGLLPDCAKPIVSPCVESRNKTGSGQVVVVGAVPLGWDPNVWGG